MSPTGRTKNAAPKAAPEGMLMAAEESRSMKRQSTRVRMVTMRDVAQASGFSPATVSIVLNNAPLARYIAPATKKRIEDAAKKLGYRPNAMARFLRSRRRDRKSTRLNSSPGYISYAVFCL